MNETLARSFHPVANVEAGRASSFKFLVPLALVRNWFAPFRRYPVCGIFVAQPIGIEPIDDLHFIVTEVGKLRLHLRNFSEVTLPNIAHLHAYQNIRCMRSCTKQLAYPALIFSDRL
jgi:hypothetical protein